MPEIKSPIGSVSVPEGHKLPTFIVDDPSMEGSLPLPFEPPVKSSKPQQISPEQFNRLRENVKNVSIQSTKEVTIPDDHQDLTQEDENLLKMFQKPNTKTIEWVRKNLKKKQNQISPQNKKKLEILLGLGKKTQEAWVDGHKIILQNLSSKQTQKILNTAAEEAQFAKENGIKFNFDQVYRTKHQVLGYAIKSIDDQDVSELLGDDDTDENREAMIAEMDSEIVDKLYTLYSNLIANKLDVSSSSKEGVVGEIKK